MIKKEELRTLFATLAKNDAKYWEDILTKAGVMTDGVKKTLRKWAVKEDFVKTASSMFGVLSVGRMGYGVDKTPSCNNAALYTIAGWCEALNKAPVNVRHDIENIGIPGILEAFRHIQHRGGTIEGEIEAVLKDNILGYKYRDIQILCVLAILINTISDVVVAIPGVVVAVAKDEKESYSGDSEGSDASNCIRVGVDPDGIIKDVLLYQDGSATFKVDTVNLLNYIQDQIPGDMAITKDSAQQLMLALNKVLLKADGGISVQDSMDSVATTAPHEHHDKSCSGECKRCGKKEEDRDVVSDITKMFKDLGIEVRVFNLGEANKKHKDNYEY